MVGLAVGMGGAIDGFCVGCGASGVGNKEGKWVGAGVGFSEGAGMGALVGLKVGRSEGQGVGG